MKIIYAAHLHGDFDTEDSMLTILKEYAQEFQPDATILVGNMLKDVLSEEEMAALDFHKNASGLIECLHNREKYPGVERVVAELAKKPSLLVAGSPPMITLPDIAKKITNDLGFPHAEIKEYAKCFLSGLEKKYDEEDPKKVINQAVQNMEIQYDALAKELKEVSSLYTLPGSCDSLLFDKFFGESTLHLKSRMIGTAKIAGYGSSHHSVMNLRIPAPLFYPHWEKCINRELGLFVSEGVAHFTRMQPDIVVSYTPPKEKLAENDNEPGSIALFDYIQQADPFLVLAGLPHTRQGASCDPLYTIHVYPGALGRGYGSDGGKFCVLECDDTAKKCQKISFYKMSKETRKPVLEKMVTLEQLQMKWRQQENSS